MEHLAILSKNRRILDKILSGEKTIESRWYKFRKTPYKNISKGDTIYFKESGCPVTAKAKVAGTIFFDNLDKSKIKQILGTYGKQIGIDSHHASEYSEKNFCTLILIEDVRKIEPFEINKKGYGLMAAWITLPDITSIKRR